MADAVLRPLSNVAVVATVGVVMGVAVVALPLLTGMEIVSSVRKLWRRPHTISSMENVTTHGNITNAATDPNTPPSVVADVRAMMRSQN